MRGSAGVALQVVDPTGSRVILASVRCCSPALAQGRKLRERAREPQWCAAVNNWGQHGVWGYVEIGNPALADQADAVDAAIGKLYVNDRELLGVAR